MPKTLSTRTTTKINADRYVREGDDLYPDRSATNGEIVTGTLVRRVSNDDIPRTTHDMSELYKWEMGDEIYGTEAQDSPFVQGYVRDIEEAYGRESDYYNGNIIFVNTMKPVGDQLKEIKRRRK